MLAARTLQGEERQFDVGLRTSTDVLDALSRLADAQSREVQSLAAYQIALVDIAFATGTLLGQSKVEFEESDGAISIKEEAGTSNTVELKPADDSDSPDDTQPNAE